MTNTLYKTIITHFESGNTEMRFGQRLYGVYPITKNFVTMTMSKPDGEGEQITHNIDFDLACIEIAQDVEKQILSHWGQEEK